MPPAKQSRTDEHPRAKHTPTLSLSFSLTHVWSDPPSTRKAFFFWLKLSCLVTMQFAGIDTQWNSSSAACVQQSRPTCRNSYRALPKLSHSGFQVDLQNSFFLKKRWKADGNNNREWSWEKTIWNKIRLSLGKLVGTQGEKAYHGSKHTVRICKALAGLLMAPKTKTAFDLKNIHIVPSHNMCVTFFSKSRSC